MPRNVSVSTECLLTEPHKESVSSTSLDSTDNMLPTTVKVYNPKASFFSSFITLLNTILGAGLLAMPSAISLVGIIPGVLIILIMGSFSAFGLHLLVVSGSKIGRESSFFALSKITYPKVAFLFDLAVAIKCFGVACSYLIIARDLVPIIIRGFYPQVDEFYLSRYLWLSVFMIVIAPLSMLKRIDSLKYTSTVALLAVVYLFFMVICFYFIPHEVPDTYVPPDLFAPVTGESILNILSRLSIFVFAFTCHQNVLPIANEKIDNSIKSMNLVIIAAIGVSSILYITIGVLGCLTFGASVNDNILMQYEMSTPVAISRIAYTFLMIFCFPLQAHPCRNSLEKLLPFKLNFLIEQKNIIFYSLSCLILISAYLIALYVESLGVVLSVVGSTGSTIICYILPFLFYYKLNQGKPWSMKKGFSLFLAIFGVLLMCICLPLSLSKSGTSSSGH